MTEPPTARYRTRFAPSPTGELHLGSLVAAVGSYLEAKRAGGEWLVRIEDLDPPREALGSAAGILETLAALGFEWTEPVLWQSSRSAAYTQAVEQLLGSGQAYECTCTRAEIAVARGAREVAEELHYPGWCRAGVRAPQRLRALRLRVPDQSICFEDAIQGPVSCNVASDVGDFVIRRRDGLFAYQLAVVVDDAAQHITHVVRGADLLSSTPRQILLQRALGGVATPAYAHLPLVLDQDGVKLSKSAGAAAVNSRQPVAELWRTLCLLRQDPPAHLRCGAVRTLWDWAIEHWTTAPLRGLRTAPWTS